MRAAPREICAPPAAPRRRGYLHHDGVGAMKRLTTLTIATACALAGAGCGDAGGLYPVHGKVLFKGEPAVGATVYFVRKGAADPTREQTLQGVVAEDGSFTLASPAGTGALPGAYVVLVEWKEGAGKKKGRSPALNAPDRLRHRYLNPNRPLLQTEVKPTANNLPPLELT